MTPDELTTVTTSAQIRPKSEPNPQVTALPHHRSHNSDKSQVLFAKNLQDGLGATRLSLSADRTSREGSREVNELQLWDRDRHAK